MAVSGCAHCQNESFELQEALIGGAHHRVVFVQCASCGTPVGIVESHALRRQQEREARLRNLERQVASIGSAVHHIGRIVGSIASQHTI
jgi:hypothetical protein